MPAPFDPYHKWLGIPPKDQPPHHYRLLGIEPFEDDAEVIESAANRLMSYLHDVAAGDSSGESQKLLNEISAARICLLSQSRKSAYDTALRRQLRAAPQMPAGGLETPSVDTAVPATSPVPGRAPWVPWMVGTALVGLVVVAATLFGIFSIHGKDEFAATSPSGAGASKGVQQLTTGSRAALVLEWPESERIGATLTVNGTRCEVPPSGNFEMPLDAGSIELLITRSGYVDVLWDGVVARGERIRYSPVWEPLDTNVQQQAALVATSQATEDNTDPTMMLNALPAAPQAPARTEKKNSGSVQDESWEATWRQLPACVDLPPLSDAAGHEPTGLLRWDADVPMQLRLVGGERLLSDTSFQLTSQASQGQQRVWIVHQVDRAQQRTEVASFGMADNVLTFRWNRDHSLAQADQLRNALLELRVGPHRRLVALRSATLVPPLSIAGPRATGDIVVRADALPELSRLRLEITHSIGTPSFAKTFDDQLLEVGQQATVDAGAGELGYPLEVAITVVTPRAATSGLRLRYELRYRSYSGRQFSWSRRNIARDLAMASNELRRSSDAANVEQLRSQLDYYRQLSDLAEGTSPLEIHYRLILVCEEGQVVLAVSKSARAG